MAYCTKLCVFYITNHRKTAKTAKTAEISDQDGDLQYCATIWYNAGDNKKGFTGASTMREHLDVSKAN